ncbi:hypothetical protein SAMD00019534_013460 [Acytostelium subglobosum LB1]|uniref:hypothetical protein n=1 Tax=Acytostelium subglobosum LB1 TaxID=1410327 RepID=UPI000644F9B2|nr:hypothetical protein SAMD00019534_013460 [Acytostelium subglobosum LB1]GAM18171.1 hypothetical protein SAMD00019534_013460 [Acytostelium subglobosum LB1]|eukprot:XP_012758767.1 hypothetical protein SAMD00019534_013460 [Acytostelium subglobosum LB1]
MAKLTEIYEQHMSIKTILDKDQTALDLIEDAMRQARLSKPHILHEYSAADLSTKQQIQRRKDIFGEVSKSLKLSLDEYQTKLATQALILVKAAIAQYNTAYEAKKTELAAALQTEGLEEYEETIYKQLTANIQSAIAVLSVPSAVMTIAKYFQSENLGVLCLLACRQAATILLQQRENDLKKLVSSAYATPETSYQIVETAVDSIFATISHLTNLTNNNKNELTTRQLFDLTLLQSDTLKELIEFHIPKYLSSPDGILKIGQKLLDLKQFNYVVLVTERALIRLNDIKVEKVELVKVEKRIKAVSQDIQTIVSVGGLAVEQSAELELLQNQVKRHKILNPQPMSITTQNDLMLQNAQLRVTSVIEMKKASKGVTNIDDQLTDALNTLIDPTHIFKLAQVVFKYGENDATILYGERCQQFISDLEKLREVRLPLQTQIDTLNSEQTDLRRVGKSLTQAQQEQLKKLEEKLAALPEWPSFGVLTARNQYDSLHLEVAQLMISSVLNSKKSLETSDDSKKKQQVQHQFHQLIELCLQKFSDPIYLMKFANHMAGSREDQVLSRIVTQLFKRCNEIESQRVVRLALKTKLEGLTEAVKKASPEKQKAMLDLKKATEDEIEALPVWPHYASLEANKPYDTTKYDASIILLNTILGCLSFVEEKIRKRKMFKINNIAEDTLNEEKDALTNQLNEALGLCLSNIESISSIVKLSEELGSKNDQLFVDISRIFHQKLTNFYSQALDYKEQQLLIELLEEESQELARTKRDMTDEDIQLLESARNQLAKVSLPYLADYLNANTFHSTMVITGLKYVYNAKQAIFTKRVNGEIKDQEADDMLAASKDRIKFMLQLAESYIKDPNTFQTLLKDLLERKEYATLELVGQVAFTRVKELREHQAQQETKKKEKDVITEQKEALDKQRRRLPTDKNKILRELLLNERYNNQLPAFYKGEPDTFALEISKILIDSVSKEKLNFEASISTLGDEGLRQMASERKRLTLKVASTVKVCVEQIKSLNTLMSFAKDLFAKKENTMVIHVGTTIEATLEHHKSVIEHKELVEKQLKEEQSRFLQEQNMKERTRIQSFIDAKTAELEKITPQYTYEEVKKTTLEITDLMIKAANAEDLGEVIRDQTILSFKIDTTVEKWDQIRNLSSEEEWAKVKEELVVYVMKRDENINSKIELLLKDGLFKQCIEIFPHPGTEQDDLANQMVLLESLYEAVDKHAYTQLPAVINIVQRYAKRCYQEWRYEKLNPILDLMQKRFPMEIKDMFEKAVDMLLVTVLPSQYPMLVQMLKAFKKRMCTVLGMDEIWQQFVEEFKKKQKGKRKLIQMLNLINDSVWNVEATNSSAIKTQKQVTGRGAKNKANVNDAPTIKKIKYTGVPTFDNSINNLLNNKQQQQY